MSDLVELLSDLALIESTISDMDQHFMSLIFELKNSLDKICADFTMSASLAAASHPNDTHSTVSTLKLPQSIVGTTSLTPIQHKNPAHDDTFRSLSPSAESNSDFMHAPLVQAKSSPGVPALFKSSESGSGATDANHMQTNSNGNKTHNISRSTFTDGGHVAINAFNHGLLAPQLTDTALECSAATGPYYLSANNTATLSRISTIPFVMRGNTTPDKHVFPTALGRTYAANLVLDSAMSTSSAGSSNNDFTTKGNATQMKRALFEASSRIAAGGAQKKAKGDMDPENHEIYCLRQKNKHFDEIAEIINNARSANGKPANLTGNAIYGRYKRNASLIAAARGEVFNPCRLDREAGTNRRVITQPVPADFDDNEDRLLVEAYQYIMENTWFLVSKRLEETSGRSHGPADCANRFALL